MVVLVHQVDEDVLQTAFDKEAAGLLERPTDDRLAAEVRPVAADLEFLSRRRGASSFEVAGLHAPRPMKEAVASTGSIYTNRRRDIPTPFVGQDGASWYDKRQS